jgi:hypothetical protein
MIMTCNRTIIFAALLLLTTSLRAQSAPRNGTSAAFTAPQPLAQPPQRVRVIVLTDIEADPDDTMSMVRLMTYSSEIDIRGLVAVTSMFLTERTAPESIHAVIDAYAKVRPNLLLHEKGFPKADYLHSIVQHGLPVYGMKGVGEGKDSGGSDWIVKVLQEPDDRPLWVVSWGGENVLAQALWKIQHTFQADKAEQFYRKLRVYTISDQDDTGAWIRKTFPSVFYICSPGSNFMTATWLGINQPYPGSDAEVISSTWLAKNIQQGHGPLGAAYPDVAYGMEGDTPSYLSLIPNGLSDPEHPDWGGWGGRYELYQMKALPGTMPAEYTSGPAPIPPSEPETRPIWTNAEDTFLSPADSQARTSAQATIWRWRADFQNDFAARMCWATKPFKDCNHPPVALLNMPDRITVHEGETFHLDASGSYDPDGDSLSYLWFQYKEAGSYQDAISLKPYATNLRNLPVTAPHVTKPETLHFIMRVTDKGAPPLSRYKRVIVQVLPAK